MPETNYVFHYPYASTPCLLLKLSRGCRRDFRRARAHDLLHDHHPALTRNAARLATLLFPRVRAAWPAIGAIALAVVLAHSGVLHLQPAPELDAHYRAMLGTVAWTRVIGILQLLAAGGLCIRRTLTMTAAALCAVLLIAMAKQVRTDRLGFTTVTSLLMLGWSAVVAWGEARRARTGALL